MLVDKTSGCLIIAEAGVNHNGSIDMAMSLVDAAAAAGADIVKFQTFKAEAVVSRFAPKAEYQVDTTGSDESQLDMVRRLELSPEDHWRLMRHCESRCIGFLSTPFDTASARFLVKELGLGQLKIPSGEITNAPLLLDMARMNRPVILSTGMSTLGEIEEALGVLAFGYMNTSMQPSREAFRQAYVSDDGQMALCGQIILLHCTTEYPAPYPEANLAAMDTLRHAFGLPVGFSDHTEGIAIPIAAVARGAVVVEKHFSLDRTLPGPDHRASLEPAELAAMVSSIRQVEAAIGDGIKRPSASELKNAPIARRRLVAARQIKEGEILSEGNLASKRPGNGISPMEFWTWRGRQASRDFAEDEPIE